MGRRQDKSQVLGEQGTKRRREGEQRRSENYNCLQVATPHRVKGNQRRLVSDAHTMLWALGVSIPALSEAGALLMCLGPLPTSVWAQWQAIPSRSRLAGGRGCIANILTSDAKFQGACSNSNKESLFRMTMYPGKHYITLRRQKVNNCNQLAVFNSIL